MIVYYQFFCHDIQLFTNREPHLNGCCELCVVDINPEYFSPSQWYPHMGRGKGIKVSFDCENWIKYENVLKPWRYVK